MNLYLFLLVVSAGVALCVHRYRNKKELPPGIPFIGRVHDLPARSWLKFYEWSKVYGPIYQIRIFGAVHVWISSEQVARDLLSKRSLIYSDRPVIPNLPDNRTSGDYLALLGRNETWKRQRRLCHALVSASAAEGLHGYPARERDRFLHLMGQDPARYREWIEQFTSRTVARLSWGSPRPAPLLRRTTAGLLEAISPAGALPNAVRWLAHLPERLSPWKRRERRRHALEERLFRRNVDLVRRALGESDETEKEKPPPPSFTRSFLQGLRGKEGSRSACDEQEATYVVGLMAIAGALTVGSPIQSFLLAMCHYPEWQRHLQDEIDVMLGGRCPEWGDRMKLPLLRAVVKEVIRWRPPVPTGIPHALEQDDVYEGYFIPAGATIHALEWAITRDESVYPDAETFNPDRWLSPRYPTYREPLTQYPNLDGYSQFGFGRRVCQGLPVVEQDLFLSVGGLAWAFDVHRQRDPQTGRRDVPVHWDDYTPLLIAKPAPFAFDLVSRSDAKMEALRAAYVAGEEEGDDDEEESAAPDDSFANDTGCREDREPGFIPGAWV